MPVRLDVPAAGMFRIIIADDWDSDLFNVHIPTLLPPGLRSIQCTAMTLVMQPLTPVTLPVLLLYPSLSRLSSSLIRTSRSAARRPNICLIDVISAEAETTSPSSTVTSWIRNIPSPVSTSTNPSERDLPMIRPGIRPSYRRALVTRNTRNMVMRRLPRYVCAPGHGGDSARISA